MMYNQSGQPSGWVSGPSFFIWLHKVDWENNIAVQDYKNADVDALCPPVILLQDNLVLSTGLIM